MTKKSKKKMLIVCGFLVLTVLPFAIFAMAKYLDYKRLQKYPLPIIKTTIPPVNNCQFTNIPETPALPSRVKEVTIQPIFSNIEDFLPVAERLGFEEKNYNSPTSASPHYTWNKEFKRLDLHENLTIIKYLGDLSFDEGVEANRETFINHAWDHLEALDLSPNKYVEKSTATVSLRPLLKSQPHPTKIEEAQFVDIHFYPTESLNLHTTLDKGSIISVTYNKDLSLYSFELHPFQIIESNDNLKIKSFKEIKKQLETGYALVLNKDKSIKTCFDPEIEKMEIGYYYNPFYNNLFSPVLKINLNSQENSLTAYLSLLDKKESDYTEQYLHSLSPFYTDYFSLMENPENRKTELLVYPRGEDEEQSKEEWNKFVKENNLNFEKVNIKRVGF